MTGLALGGASAENYNFAGGSINISGSANITAKSISVSGITANNKTYDGTISAVININTAILSGVISGEFVSVSNASGVFADPNVGNNKSVYITNITIGGSESANYKLRGCPR